MAAAVIKGGSSVARVVVPIIELSIGVRVIDEAEFKVVSS